MESSLKEYREIEHRVREFESKIALLTQEIERLNNLLRARNTDIEALENCEIIAAPASLSYHPLQNGDSRS